MRCWSPWGLFLYEGCWYTALDKILLFCHSNEIWSTFLRNFLFFKWRSKIFFVHVFLLVLLLFLFLALLGVKMLQECKPPQMETAVRMAQRFTVQSTYLCMGAKMFFKIPLICVTGNTDLYNSSWFVFFRCKDLKNLSSVCTNKDFFTWPESTPHRQSWQRKLYLYLTLLHRVISIVTVKTAF